MRLLSRLCCLFLLTNVGAPTLAAQQTGNLSAEPADKLAATAAASGPRTQQFKRALGWYAQEDYAMCRQTIDSLAHDAAGKLITDSLSGLAYHMAGMSYYQVYDDVNAIPQYLRAIEIRDRCYPGPHIDQAHTRYNLANSMHWLGRPDTATWLLREAVDIYDRVPRKDSTNWLRSLKLLGVIARESNDPDLVRSTTVAMVNLLENMRDPTLIDRYQVYYDAADNFQYLREYAASIRTGKAAVAAGYALRAEMPAKDAVSMAADAVSLMAANYGYLGNDALAEQQYRRAIHLLDSVGGNPTSLNITYANLATLAFDEGKYAAALQLVTKAETYPFNPDYPRMEAGTYKDHARILGKLGRHKEALTYFRKAMGVLAGQGVEANGDYPMMVTDSITDLQEGFSLNAARASMLQQMSKPTAALADLRKIFELQNRQRERVNTDDSRYALSTEVRKYYDQAIDLLYQLHQREGKETYLWEAFALSEEAKAYSQLAALRRSRFRTTRQEQDLQRRIVVLEREAAADATKEGLLAEAKLRLGLLRRSAGRQLENEIWINQRDPASLRTYLANQNLELLEYHLNETYRQSPDPQSFLFHLPPGGPLQMLPLSVDSTLHTRISAWRDAIEASAYRRKSLRSDQEKLDRAFLRGGQTLRDLLLPGLAAGKLKLGNRLCIVPDGSLNYLPFAALPLAGEGNKLDYATLPYLQTGRSLQLAYSARYLLELARRAAPEFEEDLLAFAPSFSGKATPGEVSQLRGLRTTKALTMNNSGGLPGLLPLQYNRSEVAAIAGLVPDHEVYYDQAASRQAFLSALGGSRILHLSSHGMVNANDANLSFVAFAQRGATLEEDELLYFNDLSTLPLNAELVVLSACETSLGRVVPGENVLSLGSAFSAAGARSTLTSLWKVDDAATEDLVVNFYAALAAGVPRAEALAQAQTHQRTDGEFAHPYYWSAMTLSGEAGPVALSGGNHWRWYLGGLALLVAGVVFLARTRVRGKV